VKPACKWRFSALPALTDLNVSSAPVLEIHHFRIGLTRNANAPEDVFDDHT
jgi:hypothetical protein